MKSKTAAGLVGLLLVAVLAAVFWRQNAADRRQRLPVAVAATPLPIPSRGASSPPAPTPLADPLSAAPHSAPSAHAAPEILSPQDYGAMTSITILVQWADTLAPAAGTSVTLRGASGGKPSAWRAQALSDASGTLETQIPDAIDALSVVALQPMAAKFEMTFGRGDAPASAVAIPRAPLTDPLVVRLQRGGRILGTVLRADDRQPVAGAMVSARLDVDTAVPIAARSGPDGQYRIDYLPAGDFVLEAHAPGLFSSRTSTNPVPVRVEAGAESGPHDLLLAAGGTLIGRVTEREGGAPIAGAVIAFEPNFQRSGAWAVSGANGGYALDGVPFRTIFTVGARAPGHALQIAKSQIGTTGTAHLDFQLAPGGVLEAFAKDEKGSPVENANFTIRPAKSDDSVPIARTGADGRAVQFNVSIDPQDEATIDVWKTGYKRTTPIGKPQFDSRGYARVDATLIKEEAIVADYSGTVADEQGHPLSGIEVSAVDRFVSASPLGLVVTDANGAYHLGPLDVVRDRTTVISLRASGKGWASNLKDPPRRGSSGLVSPAVIDFAMTRGHWVGGRVVDENRKPVAGVHLSVEGSFQSRLAPSQTEAATNGDGEFRFDDLPDRTIYVNATPLGYGMVVSTKALIDHPMEIVMKNPGAVHGRVLDRVSGRPVTRFSVTLRGQYGDEVAVQEFDDPDGRFAVEQVERNHPNRLTIESPGYAKYFNGNFQLRDSTKELEFGLDPAKPPLLITLVDAATGGPVAGATVAIGRDPSINMNQSIYNQQDSSASPDPQILTTDANGFVSAVQDNGPETIHIFGPGIVEMAILPGQRPQYAGPDGRLTIPADRGASVSGVVREDGRGAAGREVFLNSRSYNPQSNSANLRGQTGADGRYRLAGLTPGKYELNVLKVVDNITLVGASRSFELSKNQNLTLDIGEEAGASALFGVIRIGGRPAPGMTVWLSPDFETGSLKSSAVTNANGEYQFLGLHPGLYTFTVDRGVGGGIARKYAETVEAGAAPTQHDADLKELHRVSIHPVYPPDFPPAIRTLVWSAVLFREGSSPAPANPPEHEPIDSHLQTDATSESAVFTGRFQGEYRLELIYADHQGMSGNMNVERILNIDNLEGDIDLGDVLIPLPAPPRPSKAAPARNSATIRD